MPNDINKDINNAKGIILIGYINDNKDITFKVLVKYEDDDGNINKIIYSLIWKKIIIITKREIEYHL